MKRFSLLLLTLAALASVQLNGQLLFNEVMAVNDNGQINPVTGVPGDWIEIYNGTGYAVDLSAYYLTDKRSDTLRWQFPAGTILNPGKYQLVWADGTNDNSDGCHTSFKLDASGETLYLNHNSGELFDSIRFPRMHVDISYGISQDGSRVYFSIPTPGEVNNSGSGFLYSAGVNIEPPAAIYSHSVQVTMDGEAAGTIRYTLDGREPDLSDPVYAGPLNVSQNSVIRARLWQEGFEGGATATTSYIISTGYTMPVFSISTDPLNFWDDEIGIYVEGTNGIPGRCMDIPVNWNQDWERPLSIEYFNLDGERMLQQDVGTKMHGGCSRTAPMKSLGLYARGRYGSSIMKQDFFTDKAEIDRYKGLILRNSGNDNQYTMFRDAMIQSVVWPKMDVDFQAYETVRVFMNGEFFGIHNLREKVNEHWITSNYGIDAEDIDFIKNRSEVFAGSIDEFDTLQSYLAAYSLAEQDKYDWVADRVDIDSYTDYLITHLFFANRDWPGNNQKCWRENTPGGKWRWILFDLDFTMGIYNFNPALDMFSFSTADDSDNWPNPRWSTLIIRRLLENDGFREQFIQKYLVYLNTTLNTERVHAKIDSFYYNIQDVLPEQMARWNRPWSLESWNEHCDLLRTFANDRPTHVRNNMRNFFNLGRDISLEVEATDGTCAVRLNDVRIAQEGMRGYYMAGTALDLTCSVQAGYKFSHWEVLTGDESVLTLIPELSTWKYNDTGIDPGSTWKDTAFDDSTWPEGAGELGYGDGGENTVLDYGGNDQEKHMAYYFRKNFDIEIPEQYTGLTLRVMRDDGVVVYLNGEEVLRNNMPAGDILPTTPALGYVGYENESTYFEFSLDPEYLIAGTNILAVEVHQSSVTSSDLSFDLELMARKLNGNEILTFEQKNLRLTPESDISIKAVTEVYHANLDVELYINEFMASNQEAHTDPTGASSDWFEIYNAGSEDVDLAGLFLTDNSNLPVKWQIPYGSPEETTVGASNYVIFYADESTDNGPMHTNFKLSASGEFLGLSTQSESKLYWLDSLHFNTQATNISEGRYPDGSDSWMAMETYTPGASNEVTISQLEEEMEQVLQLDIFPNPVAERLNIRLTCSNASEAQAFAAIYDLTGKICLETAIDGWSNGYTGGINVSALPSGIYLLVVEHGMERISRKIIKSDR